MYKSRASFKQALRYCKRHKEQIQADGLTSSYSNMHDKQFCNDVAKSANRKATIYVNKIGNVVGEENICSKLCGKIILRRCITLYLTTTTEITLLMHVQKLIRMFLNAFLSVMSIMQYMVLKLVSLLDLTD